MVERKTNYQFYAPETFRATWKKFQELIKRDGGSPSAELRIWIEQYVRGHDPGNPQRPITAYVMGTPDEWAERYKVLEAELIAQAERHQGWIYYREIRDLCAKWVESGKRRVEWINKLVAVMRSRGFKVVQGA